MTKKMFQIGKVTNREGIGIPASAVWISDEKGNRNPNSPRVRTDESGNYKIQVAVPVPSPLGTGLMAVPVGTHISVDSDYVIGSEPTITKIDFDKNPDVPVNYIVYPKPQEIDEIPVIFNKSKRDCEKSGGLWDEKTKTCKMPELKVDASDEKIDTKEEEKKKLTKFQKQLIIGGVILLGGLTITALLVKLTKND